MELRKAKKRKKSDPRASQERPRGPTRGTIDIDPYPDLLILEPRGSPKVD